MPYPINAISTPIVPPIAVPNKAPPVTMAVESMNVVADNIKDIATPKNSNRNIILTVLFASAGMPAFLKDIVTVRITTKYTM